MDNNSAECTRNRKLILPSQNTGYTTIDRKKPVTHQQVQYTIFAKPKPKRRLRSCSPLPTVIKIICLCRTSPQRLHPRTSRHQPTQAHPPQIPPRNPARRIRKVDRHWQPRARNHRIRPPPLIKLPILLILVLRNRPPISLHLLPSRAPASLNLPLAAEAQKVAGHAAEPCAVGPEIETRGGGVVAVYPGDECRGNDAGVGEEADVLERLVGGVTTCLQQRDAVEDDIGAGFWAGEERADPCVEREEAEEA
jgi:hypothetical protein